MIRFVFFDLDDTIFDFHKAEQIALKSTLEHFNAPADAEVIERYHEINIEHWKRLEKGEITREQVKTGRFRVLFCELGIENISLKEVTAYYESRLAIGHYFVDGALEILKQLSLQYRLFLVSNGTLAVQKSRLKSSEIEKYFEKIFISEAVGYDKPNIKFFEKCFSEIKEFKLDEAIIIGDSLTSDIKGGKESGIKTVWFNKNNTVNSSDISPDYEIKVLGEIKSLLEQIQR